MKEKELSDVLYGKKVKKNVSHTMSLHDQKEEANFQIRTLSQVQQDHSNVVKLLQVEVSTEFSDNPIIVQPVINLNAKDLHKNDQRQLLIPEIKVELMININ